ncbi:hypothetical protein [Rhodococcus sp. NPDC058514]|uniref:hypothetical protein n=1 Tax=unclassified Rhodococcus (in: high G+C Gram-positive bacteria) TaxID=192944 RepID=UPI003667B188
MRLRNCPIALAGALAAAAAFAAPAVGAEPPTTPADLNAAMAVLIARGAAADDPSLAAARALIGMGAGHVGTAPAADPDPFAALRFDLAPLSPTCGAGRALAGRTGGIGDAYLAVWLEQPPASKPIPPVSDMRIVWFNLVTLRGGTGVLDDWADANAPDRLPVGVPVLGGAVVTGYNPTVVGLYGTARNTVDTCTYVPGFKMIGDSPR